MDESKKEKIGKKSKWESLNYIHRVWIIVIPNVHLTIHDDEWAKNYFHFIVHYAFIYLIALTMDNPMWTHITAWSERSTFAPEMQ